MGRITGSAVYAASADTASVARQQLDVAAEAHRRRRRTRSRSGVCVNVHPDLRTLADLRDADDLEDLVLRGDGWNLTRAAAPRHCDIHHLHHRTHSGPTRTSNAALLLCRFHHRLLHHHGWQLAIHDGHWVAIDPHHTHWTGHPTPLPDTCGDPP